MRYIVTGGHGFLGTEIVRTLKTALPTATIIAPDRFACDLMHYGPIFSLLEPGDCVIHAAAKVGGIGLNLAQPADLGADNLTMGLHVLKAAAQKQVAKVVMLGSVCAYPEICPIPFGEHDLFNGAPEPTNGAYGQAKRLLLVLGHAYREQYGLNVIHLIPTNLYGPGDDFSPHSSHVIPALIRKIQIAKKLPTTFPVEVWGDGTATREFLYVQDAADAIVRATLIYDDPAPLNLGTGEEIAIAELVQLMSQLMGYSGPIVWDSAKPNGQPRRCVDTSAATTALGWVATTKLVDGLQTTINVYEAESDL